MFASGALLALTSVVGGLDGVGRTGGPFWSWQMELSYPLYAVTAVAAAAAQSAPDAVSTAAQEADTWASDTGPHSLPMTLSLCPQAKLAADLVVMESFLHCSGLQ